MSKRKIISLAWPAVLEMMLYMLLDVVDVAFVGRLGSRALAATGLGAQIYFSALFIFSALGAGAAALVARAIGAGDKKMAGRVAGQALSWSVLAGLVIGLLAFFCADDVLNLFSFEFHVRQLAAAYIRITGAVAVFALPFFIGNGIFRGAGLTRIPLAVAGITNVIHVAADYVLIFGKLGFPALGVQGAAAATAFAQVCGFAIVVFLLFSGVTPLKIALSDICCVDEALVRRIVGLGVPAGCEEALLSLGRIVSSFMLAGLGTLSFAAHQVALTAESISFMPGYGFAVAAATLVGQSLGAKRPDCAHSQGWQAAKIALCVMGSVSLLFLFLPDFITRIFTNDSNVAGLGAVCLRIAAIEQPTIAIDMVMAGALRGAGDTRTPMLVAVLSTWLLRLPLFYLSINVFSFGLPMIWFITAFDSIVRASFLIYTFQKRRWQKIVL